MKIYVDADAFPKAVRNILIRAAERRELPLIFVANRAVRTPQSPLISSIIVPAGPDEADDRIVELAEPGELVITADIPLADRIVSKGAFALDPRGELYTHVNIKQRLATRDLMNELRGAGLVTGGPASMDDKDTEAFANGLDRLLTKLCRDCKE